MTDIQSKKFLTLGESIFFDGVFESIQDIKSNFTTYIKLLTVKFALERLDKSKKKQFIKLLFSSSISIDEAFKYVQSNVEGFDLSLTVYLREKILKLKNKTLKK